MSLFSAKTSASQPNHDVENPCYPCFPFLILVLQWSNLSNVLKILQINTKI